MRYPRIVPWVWVAWLWLEVVIVYLDHGWQLWTIGLTVFVTAVSLMVLVVWDLSR